MSLAAAAFEKKKGMISIACPLSLPDACRTMRVCRRQPLMRCRRFVDFASSSFAARVVPRDVPAASSTTPAPGRRYRRSPS